MVAFIIVFMLTAYPVLLFKHTNSLAWREVIPRLKGEDYRPRVNKAVQPSDYIAPDELRAHEHTARHGVEPHRSQSIAWLRKHGK